MLLLCFLHYFASFSFFFFFFDRFEEFEREGFEFGSNYILVSLFSVQTESLIDSVSVKDDLDIFEVHE